MVHSKIYERSRPKVDRDKKLLTVLQVSVRLNVSRSQVYKLIEAGDLPAAKMGEKKGFRVRESVVDDFLEKRCANFD